MGCGSAGLVLQSGESNAWAEDAAGQLIERSAARQSKREFPLVIRVSGVSKFYGRGQRTIRALRDVDLEIGIIQLKVLERKRSFFE